MPASISITNIADNMILGKSFTVYGDFTAAFRPETSGSKTLYVVDRPACEGQSRRASISVRCILKNSAGGTITSVKGFVDPSNTHWQADFANQAPGLNLKLTPELTVDSSVITGTTIIGLEIRDPLGISINMPQPAPPGSGSRVKSEKTFSPGGDFDLNPGAVREFLSVVVVHGVVVGDSILTTTDLRVFNTRKKWDMKKDHHYDKPSTHHASHVIKLRLANGKVFTTSRKNLP